MDFRNFSFFGKKLFFFSDFFGERLKSAFATLHLTNPKNHGIIKRYITKNINCPSAGIEIERLVFKMNVIQAARELGKALQADPAYAQYTAAKLANDKDETLQKQIADFNSKRMELNNEMAKENKDTAVITSLNNELNSIYMSVTSNPNMMAFEAAKAQMDDILESINYIVTCAANGDDPMTCPESAPHSCGGSCGSCSGCH